jgi:hypothetical protein
MIDKKIIQKKKNKYGDSFNALKNKWNNFIYVTNNGKLLTATDVARMLSLLKETRIKSIQSQILKKKMEEHPDPQIIRALQIALDDSILDKDNYDWIRANYIDYLGL